MKAVVAHGYGDVSQLSYEALPDPQPGPGEVLVQLRATSVNPIDWKLLRGDLKSVRPLEFPAVLGRDLVGTVVGRGPGVKHPDLGDRVMGIGAKTHAERVVIRAETLTEVPAGLSDEQAATLPLVGLTGTQMVRDLVKPEKGQTVLVTGALGSVGRVAVHALRQMGVRVIAGVRSSQMEQAKVLQSFRVLALDDEVSLAELRDLDAVADTIDGELAEKLLPCVRPGGCFATVLPPPKNAQQRHLRIESMQAHPDSDCLRELAADLALNRFDLPISRTLRLANARDAYALARKGGIGKVVMVA